MWGPWGGGWWGVGMGLLSLVFLGLIVAGIVLVLRGPSEGPSRTGEGRRALDILDERFARGEIDREEYEASKQVLTEGPR
jgi:putative membrane protein